MATQTGYKVSELGMIPQDWDVVELEEVAEIKSGGTPSTNRPEFWNGHILWCTPTDITSLSGKYLSDTNRKISELGLNNSAAELLPTGSVLMTSRATIGECAIVKQPMTTNQGFKNFICNRTVNNEFLYYLLSSQKDKFIELCNGSTFLEISTTQVRKFKIAIPKSITEQTAIATVLSDTDALISSLQTLIAKKQAIKLLAMQNLLSGKIRLPEFTQRPDGSSKTTRQTELGCVPEDWEIGTIGKDCVLKARIGWQSLRTDEYLESGEYGLITGTDFNNGLVDWKTCSFVSEWRYKQDTNIQLKVNDVLITKDGTIGKLGYINELPFSATLNSGIYVIRPKNSNLIEPMFLFYLFSSEYFNDFISVISAGSTITHLYQKDFVNFQFPLPSKTEQTAIAQLLSDMDAEIEALECRLKKTQSLKQGMMQALLTGKIRLPLE